MSTHRVLYIDNLNFSTTSETLTGTFADTEAEVHLINDKETQQSRGFAVAIVPSDKAEATAAKMNGVTVDDREIRVSVAERAPIIRMWLARSPEEFPDSVRRLLA